jgi:transposase
LGAMQTARLEPVSPTLQQDREGPRASFHADLVVQIDRRVPTGDVSQGAGCVKRESGFLMNRFVEGEDRTQGVLLPEFLGDHLAEDNPVRAIDVFVGELGLRALRFEGVVPETTGRPAYYPVTMLKIYVYGYIYQVQSSRRLERETARNVKMMWQTGRVTPDFKTIADFRKNNGPAIRSASREFVGVSNIIRHANRCVGRLTC